MTTVAGELEHMELQFSSDTVNNRWDDEWDNENSSARLFERSRIKALAGRLLQYCYVTSTNTTVLELFCIKALAGRLLHRSSTKTTVTVLLPHPACTSPQPPPRSGSPAGRSVLVLTTVTRTLRSPPSRDRAWGNVPHSNPNLKPPQTTGLLRCPASPRVQHHSSLYSLDSGTFLIWPPLSPGNLTSPEHRQRHVTP